MLYYCQPLEPEQRRLGMSNFYFAKTYIYHIVDLVPGASEHSPQSGNNNTPFWSSTSQTTGSMNLSSSTFIDNVSEGIIICISYNYSIILIITSIKTHNCVPCCQVVWHTRHQCVICTSQLLATFSPS